MERSLNEARILAYAGTSPQVHPDALVLPSATIVGDVTLAARASVWFGAVVRGDCERIEVGEESNVQDGAVIHADPGLPTLLGSRVTVGHRAVVHGARVGDRVLVGMGALILNGAVVGDGALIGAGAVVPEGTRIPPGALVLGVPARVGRDVTPAERERAEHGADHYLELAAEYRAMLQAG